MLFLDPAIVVLVLTVAFGALTVWLTLRRQRKGIHDEPAAESSAASASPTLEPHLRAAEPDKQDDILAEPSLWTNRKSTTAVARARYTESGEPEFHEADFKDMKDRARGPDVLTDAEWSRVAKAKAEGNEHFVAGRTREACRQYNRAIEVFGERPGGTAEQRGEKSKLYANRAECLLRLEQWPAAEQAAARAVGLDPSNVKARYRRARALEALGAEHHLEAAMGELSSIERKGAAEQQLHRRLLAAREALRTARRREAGGLRKAFASGGLKLGAPSDEQPAAPSAPPDGACRSIHGTPLATHPSDVQTAPATPPRWLRALAGSGADVQRRHLVDVYRAAVGDAMCMSGVTAGRAPHGIGAPNYSPVSVLCDFLVFCKLSLVRGVLPRTYAWDWSAFLSTATPLLATPLHLDASPPGSPPEGTGDAEAGTAAAMRELASFVYVDGVVHDEVLPGRPAAELRAEWMRSVGYREATSHELSARAGGDEAPSDSDEELPPSAVMSACMQQEKPSPAQPRRRRMEHVLTFDRDPSVFGDVGGVHRWRQLLHELAPLVEARETETAPETPVPSLPPSPPSPAPANAALHTALVPSHAWAHRGAVTGTAAASDAADADAEATEALVEAAAQDAAAVDVAAVLAPTADEAAHLQATAAGASAAEAAVVEAAPAEAATVQTAAWAPAAGEAAVAPEALSRSSRADDAPLPPSQPGPPSQKADTPFLSFQGHPVYDVGYVVVPPGGSRRCPWLALRSPTGGVVQYLVPPGQAEGTAFAVLLPYSPAIVPGGPALRAPSAPMAPFPGRPSPPRPSGEELASQ